MGDGADDALDMAINEMIEDSYDLTWREGFSRHYRIPKKVCRYCGKGGLHWEIKEKGWRLCNNGNEPHECLLYKRG